MTSKKIERIPIIMSDVKKNQLIVKSNYLVEASYKLTLQEQRIILFLASMVKPEDEDFNLYQINIKDFQELIGVQNKAIYEEAKEVTKKLMERVLIIKDPANKRELQVGWVSSAEYFEKQGYIELEFSPKLKPYLLKLKSRFTKYQLSNVIKLKSAYSIRIYELLKQYETIGERYFKLSELRNILGIKEKEYPLYANFKQRILNKAEKDLNEKTDILISFKEKKEGRKIVGVRFFITPKNREIKKESLDNNPSEYEYISKKAYSNFLNSIANMLDIDNKKSKLLFDLLYKDIKNNLKIAIKTNTLKTNNQNYVRKTINRIINDEYESLINYLNELEKKEQSLFIQKQELNNELEEQLENDFRIHLQKLFKEKYYKLSDNKKELLELEYIETLNLPNKTVFKKKYKQPGIESNKFDFYFSLKEKVLSKDDLSFEKWKQNL